MGKMSHLLTYLLQMIVKLVHWIGLMGLIIGFTQIILVKYVTNTQYLNKDFLRLLSESGQN